MTDLKDYEDLDNSYEDLDMEDNNKTGVGINTSMLGASSMMRPNNNNNRGTVVKQVQVIMQPDGDEEEDIKNKKDDEYFDDNSDKEEPFYDARPTQNADYTDILGNKEETSSVKKIMVSKHKWVQDS